MADELGFAFYDKEIISKIAENLDLNEQYIEEILSRGFTTSYPYAFRRSFSTQIYTQNQTVEILTQQHRIIRMLAEKEDAVMVGRGAEIILRHLQPYNIFLYADMEAKKERCRQRAAEDEKNPTVSWNAA